MRIVTRREFLKLPANTLYAEYEPCIFGPLNIKGESLPNDWSQQSIADAIEASDSGDLMTKLELAEKHGVSLTMNFNCGMRNGLFGPDEELYAVYEKADVAALIERLKDCL